MWNGAALILYPKPAMTQTVAMNTTSGTCPSAFVRAMIRSEISGNSSERVRPKSQLMP